MANYQNLDVWKRSMQLVKAVYEITKLYPKDEVFALTQQTRRAVVSIPSNIAEGIGRNYKKDTIQFLYISKGSLYELETLINIAHRLDYMSSENLSNLILQNNEVLRLLNGLISYEKSDLK